MTTANAIRSLIETLERLYAPSDAEYEVTVSAQQERDLTQAVLILERALKDQKP